MSKPHIAIVVKYYPPLTRISGIVTFISLLARHLAARAEVSVVTYRPTRRDAAELEIDGCAIHRVDAPFPVASGHKVRSLRPDVTLVVSGVHDLRKAVPYFAAFDAAAGRGRRLFFQATNVGGAPSAALARVLGRYESILCASASIADRFAPRFGARVVTFLPAVDVEQLAAVVAEPCDAFRIGFVNHVNRVKGADIALDAIVPLLRELDGSDAVVAGVGELEPELRERYGSEPNLQFRGFLDEAARLSLLASCDVTLLPFRTDVSVLGVSQTVLEIMALGGVAIGSPTGAILPAVHDGVDGVIASGADATRDRVRTLFAEPESRARIGAAAQAAAAQQWDVRTRVDQMLSLLTQG
jgi:glycosyltransferase involved in cell wall biosynthesis